MMRPRFSIVAAILTAAVIALVVDCEYDAQEN